MGKAEAEEEEEEEEEVEEEGSGAVTSSAMASQDIDKMSISANRWRNVDARSCTCGVRGERWYVNEG